jgi:ABC-type xylose transport system permease subunit
VYQLNRTPKESFKQLCIIYIFFLLGILLFTGFVLFFVVTHDSGLIALSVISYTIVKWIFAFFALTLLPAAIFSFRNRIERLDHSISLDSKLIFYRNLYIFKIVIICFICMINSVLLFLYGQLNLLIPLILFILFFLLNRPYIERISDELHLSADETEELRL